MFDILTSLLKTYNCGYTLEPLTEAVLTSTHNVRFGSEIRKLGIPLQTPVFFLNKSEVCGGIHFTDMFS